MYSKKIKKIKLRTSILIDGLRQLGILNGHSNYSKFIILGKGRSGSNFLRSLLESHSEIETFGEIFRNPNSIGWDRPGYQDYLNNPRLTELMQNEPINFLENKVFRRFSNATSTVGFKLFYHQPKGDNRAVIWEYLKNHREYKIIHIRRINLLKRLVSMKLAFMTNQWVSRKHSSPSSDNPKIHISYEECIKDFQENQKNQKFYDDLFINHPKTNISYEELVSHQHKKIAEIQDFLGVRHEALASETRKQSARKMSEVIQNYGALKKKFKCTAWEAYFED